MDNKENTRVNNRETGRPEVRKEEEERGKPGERIIKRREDT